MKIPSFLSGYEELHQRDPHMATIQWFKDARYGLFLHYGVYSILGRGEWVMLQEKIPVAEYEKLKDRFTAEGFDPGYITDLALDAGMRYVTITSRHHDSFCLFETNETDFNSLTAPCGRDLIAELADACASKKLGLFLYYSYALDWRHPYFFSREDGWENARPAYQSPEPTYLYREAEDFAHYIRFVHKQLRELLTQYGPIAGIWLDPIMPYYRRPDLFPIDETYALIRSLQPQCLISFKQGANGHEDFASCERDARSLEHLLTGENAALARRAWEANRDKHNEICDTLQQSAWGHNEKERGKHKSTDQAWEMLANSRNRNCNLLLNTGPLPDGTINGDDDAVLRALGERLGTMGFP